MNVIIGVNIRQGTQFISNIRQGTQFLRPQARVDAISSTVCPVCQALHTCPYKFKYVGKRESHCAYLHMCLRLGKNLGELRQQ